MAERRSLTLWVHLAPEPTGGLCGPSGSWTHSWTSVGAQGRPKEGDLLEPREREAKTLLGGRGCGQPPPLPMGEGAGPHLPHSARACDLGARGAMSRGLYFPSDLGVA